MKGKRIACLFIFQLLVLFVGAQKKELRFTLVEGTYGKPLGKIRNMTQDEKGYMWFAGEGGHCIYKYDGNVMTTFAKDNNNPNSLGGVNINSIYADYNGIIWIGSYQGLDKFNPTTGIFTHYPTNPNDSTSVGGPVTPVLRDRKGRLWVGTENGLDRLDEKTGKFIHHRHDPSNPRSLSCNIVTNIYEDHQGVVWIATGYPWDNQGPDAGGLNKLNEDGSFTRFMHDPKDPNSVTTNKVRAIFEDSRGNLWIGTSGDGLQILDRQTGKFIHYPFDPSVPEKLSRPPLPNDKWRHENDNITFIQEDVMGSIWIGTMFSGINRYDTLSKQIIGYEGSNGFPDSSAWNAYQSRDGVLWISTQQNHLYHVDPFQPTFKFTPTTDQVFEFLEDQKGMLWVGTLEGGLIHYDNQGKLLHQLKYNASDSFSLRDPRSIVLGLYQDQEDSLWVGTSENLELFDIKSERFSTVPINVKFKAGMDRKPFLHILEDNKDSKWITTYGAGLVHYNYINHQVRQFKPENKDSSFLSDMIFDILKDNAGRVWIAGNMGLSRWDSSSQTFHHYLKGHISSSLLMDSRGILWAGGEAGLYQYDKNSDRFLPYFDSASEITNIHMMVEDRNHKIWLYTPSSIIRLNPVTGETYVCGEKFGIGYQDIQPSGGYIDSKGRLYIGQEKGFSSFYPEEVVNIVPLLKILITGLHINNQPVSPGNQYLGKKSVEALTDLSLDYNENNVSFNFSAIDFRAPETIRYFTMLEGYNNIWREERGGKNSSYFNVPPGHYVYRIKGFNTDGVKGEFAVSIFIRPPWWKTWWAYSMYALVALIIIFALYRYQKKVIIEKERQKQQQFELAQAKEIEKAYHELRSTQAQLIQSEKMASLGELTAGIAHEIQNPLNFVNNFADVNSELIDEAERALDQDDKEETRKLMTAIRDNEEKVKYHGRRADAIVKSMLQHSRTSTGQKEPTDINALADEYLRLAYHGLRAKDKTFNAALKTDFDPAIGKINIISQDIGRVLLNLYNNAFYAILEKQKATVAGFDPTITVSTRRSGNKIQISIKDNGNGIPKQVMDKIFQPFFTTKPTGQGTGLGLSLSYDIVKAHGGEITVDSKTGENTLFIIELPT